MEWLDIGAYLTLLTGIGTVWWRLNSRIDALDTKFERKFDQLNTLLLSLSHDLGELRGAAHSHAPPAD